MHEHKVIDETSNNFQEMKEVLIHPETFILISIKIRSYSKLRFEKSCTKKKHLCLTSTHKYECMTILTPGKL